MQAFTYTTRRLVTAALAAGTLMIAVPVAQADSGFQGSPDAIDRAVAAKLDTSFQGSPDAIERALAARQAPVSFQGSPDALDRAHAPRGETMVAPVVESSPVVEGAGFDWSDFGLGAGVGIGSALLLTGLGLGVLTFRRGQRVTTA